MTDGDDGGDRASECVGGDSGGDTLANAGAVVCDDGRRLLEEQPDEGDCRR